MSNFFLYSLSIASPQFKEFILLHIIFLIANRNVHLFYYLIINNLQINSKMSHNNITNRHDSSLDDVQDNVNTHDLFTLYNFSCK